VYDEGYVAFVDRLVADAPLVLAPPDMTERWQADMADAIVLAGGLAPLMRKPRPRRRFGAARPNPHKGLKRR
jgi:hypothetical protein